MTEPAFDLPRRLAAEALGTAFLLAAVVGSGIMAERLSGGNVAIALLCNTVATGAALTVLIAMFGPVSGAHFNPAVSFAFALRHEIAWKTTAAYGAAQLAGGIAGVWAAHLMFGETMLQVSTKLRAGPAMGLSEFVATFGLVAVVFMVERFRPRFTAMAVGLYVAAGYWFTASTCFANPAVTVARSLSDTFAGIAPASAPLFIAAEFAGALIATGFCAWLLAPGAGAGATYIIPSDRA
jgi:glycerol uptake facilitator-like aquaporin